ncbi:DUF2989 domain-containing protein [Thalassotalea sp. M1531]|uniref:DUF2989 domain-containing protein n=1 Tax=Thalassotalea algicola TaxID=2716224 RepID=A0A7Y0LDQ9_9GAMM|nr:DUF2989 domain-containing protein [Thalassotalea algicola]NMP32318.1 DUF2989 domain-containing protein [Thalassotalea algicola]
MKFIIAAFFSTLLLTACDSGPDLAKICKDSPEMCGEFKEDSWCKRERVGAIFANHALNTTKADKQKYNLLIAYEKYAVCVNHASKIEHIKLKEKKKNRIDNYVKAKERIKQLSDETKTSKHPELLFYHWSRYMNEVALEKFLKMEGSAELETPESQFNLATYYIKRNPDKTLDLLFHALELVKPGEIINIEIFKSITTIFTDKEEYKQAYIWLKVLNIYAPDDEEISKKGLKEYSQFYKLDANFLDQVAEATLDKISEGRFVAPSH